MKLALLHKTASDKITQHQKALVQLKEKFNSLANRQQGAQIQEQGIHISHILGFVKDVSLDVKKLGEL